MAIDDFQRGSYQARIVEFPGRRKLTDVSTNESTVYDIELAEGNVTQSGTAWTPDVMVGLEERIQHSVEQIRAECNTKQNTLVPGSNISLEPQQDGTVEISATGGGGGSSTLSGLDDTNISSPQNGQALIYDATSSKWVNANGGSGSATLAGLTDVTLTTPTADQVLKYDGTKWVNGEGGGDVELSKTVSGSICSFSDGADSLPMKSVVCEINAVQSGTGDPSPSNVRPISGFTGLNLTRAGKNLINWKVSSTAFTFALPAGKYYFSTNGTFSSGLWYFRGYDAEGNLYTAKDALGLSIAWTHSNSSHWNYAANSVTGFAFTVPSGCSSLEIFKQDADGTVSAMINVGTTASTYADYTATVIPITWQTEAGTVYGGELDVTSGVLTVTHKKVVFDGSEEGWDWYNAYQQLSIALTESANYVGNQVTYLCDCLKPVANNDRVGNYGNYSSLVSSGAGVALSVPETSKTDALTWLSSHNVTFVYELATPQTYQLTPQQVNSLLGVNNTWHDANGDTTVTYQTQFASDIVDTVESNVGIDDLKNVNVSSLANGQVLKYNSTSQKWENANESGGGASALNDLSDVSVPSPTAGQVLTYQIAASVGQWVASPVPTPWFELTETVPAAQDPTNPDTVSIVLRDSRITSNSTVDVYTSVQGKNYVSLLITTGSISITYVAGQSSFEVKARVS